MSIVKEKICRNNKIIFLHLEEYQIFIKKLSGVTYTVKAKFNTKQLSIR